MLHLCPSEGESEEEAMQATSDKPDVTCVVCEYALTQLEDMLEDNRTEVCLKVSSCIGVYSIDMIILDG